MTDTKRDYLPFNERWDKSAFVKYLPVAACMVSREGVIESINNAFAEMFGHSVEDMEGRPMHHFSEDAARNIKNDFITFDRGSSVPDHEFYVENRIYWVTVRPVLDEQGVAKALVACLSNITTLRVVENKVQQACDTVVNNEVMAQDGLMPLNSKQIFYIELEQQLHKMLAKKKPLSLILLQIDDFQSYLQYEGKYPANQVLQQVTDIIKNIGGDSLNLIYRYELDKFSIILPNIGLKETATLAEQICQNIYDAAIPNQYNGYQRMTVSIGVYTERSVISYMRIINGADNALYLARKNGKNRVEIY